ncbi:DUF6049 family protein [Salinifilum aidingensis]
MRFLLAALVAALVFALLPAVPAPRAHAQAQQLTRFEVTGVAPNVVTERAPGELVVSGRLTNTSDHVIDDVEARVQRGEAPTTEPGVQQALRGEANITTDPQFTPVVDRIRPGEQVPVEIRIPFSGPDSLDITEPGTYPLLVNVNGQPESSSRARIAEANFLLPVQAPPGGTPQPPPAPTPTSLLVPLVDYPRMERSTSPGNRAILTDDRLAGELSPGGRLYELVQAVNERVNNGSPLGSALCFAIDPDLLATAKAMSRSEGYLVRTSNGGTEPGIGGEAAGLWLSKLREAVDGRCVLALPYADADLVALSRAGLPDVTRGAVDGSRVVGRILNEGGNATVDPRPATWPISGALDQRTAADLPRTETALLDTRSLDVPAGTLAPARIRGTDLTAQPLDPLLSSALNPLRGTPRQSSAKSPPTEESATAQDALGSLLFRSTLGSLPDSTSVLAPPRRWNINGEQLRGLLDGMRALTDAGYVEPTALPHPGGRLPEAELTYPDTAASAEIPQPVLRTLARANYAVGDLYRSSSEEQARHVDPAQVTTPLRNGLLRGVSSAWRGDPTGARRWTGLGRAAVRNTLSHVYIEEFQGKIALASSNSAIPLTVVNDLPVTVSLRLRVGPTPGVEVSDLGTLRIPAHSRRQFWPEVSVHRVGEFNLDVAAVTEGGTPLGRPKRLQVDSSAYGPLIPAITITAGGLLVVLSAMRIVRRMRAGRGGTPDETPTTEFPPGDATADGDRTGN